MEADKNPFPDIKLFRFERLRNAADFIGNVFHLVFDQVRHEIQPYESDHFKPSHEIKDGAHIHRLNRAKPVPYDSEGNWHNPSGW